MNVANIISIIGNNSSTVPILLKDGIESSSKLYLANKQGDKISKEQGFYEAREAGIEEFGTTAIWFCTPIVVAEVFNKVVKKVLKLKDNKLLDTDSQLLNGKNYQTLEKNIKNSGDKFIKSDAEKFTSEKLANLIKGRNLLGVALAIGLLAGLTIFKQRITEKSIDKHGTPEGLSFKGLTKEKIKKHLTFANSSYEHKSSENPPSFKGVGEMVAQASIDAGVGGIRIATARDKDERKEYIFKTITFIVLTYFGGPVVEKALNAAAKAFNLPIELDAKVIADEEFAKDVAEACKSESAKNKMLAFVKTNSAEKPIETEEKIIKFIDEELKKAKLDSKGNFEEFTNKTLEVARKSGFISIENNERDVTKFIDTKKIQKINEYIGELIETTAKTGDSSAFIKKLKATKYGAVIANIAICSALVGVALPKMQYLFREKGIGTVASPGIKASNEHHKKVIA